MFEEDFERCFICQGPSKGLYCSSDCRQKDQGIMSRAAPGHGHVHITSQIPPALSPHMRPHHPSGLSPRSTKPRTTSNSTSSGSSSAVSSPLQSPRTNPIEMDSPQKGLFNLPPSAYPHKQSFGVTSSVPIKIPSLASRTSPVFSAVGTPGSVNSTVYANNASIETLRFGRRPAAVNSVTSPNALIPRCACGLPANHKGRSTSKDRADLFDSGFSRLSLNPPGTAKEEPISRSLRIVSDSAIPPFALSPKVMAQAITPNTHVTPLNISEHPSPIAPTTHLSRSRSDPNPYSPQDAARVPPAPVVSNIAPPHRQSANHTPTTCQGRENCCSGLRQCTNALGVTNVASPSRGRSRERTSHLEDEACCMVSQAQHGVLNHPPEREAAPSRSRNRRDSPRRSGTRSRSRVRERSRPREWTRELGMSRERPADGEISPKHQLSPRRSVPQILPSWSRPQGHENGVAPGMRRTGSGQERRREVEREGRGRGRGRSQEEERRARSQFGHVFGVAAG